MLEIHHHGPIHEIRLARPPANALNSELLVQLRDAVESAPLCSAVSSTKPAGGRQMQRS